MSKSPLPPKIPSALRNSIFHQAATASVFAPLIAIGLAVVSSGGRISLYPQLQRTVAFISGMAGSIIILIGLICGIVALFGIPKHGKNGILGKALCGIIIPLLLFGLTIPSFVLARSRAIKNNQYRMSPEDQLMALADQINKQGSVMVDKVTRLDGAEALPNRTLLYKYSLISKTSSEIPPDALNRIVRPDVVRKYNTLPEMAVLRDNGISITYRYRDKAGQLIGDISVGPSDLAK